MRPFSGCMNARENSSGFIARSTAVEFVALDWDHVFALARYLHPRLP